MSIVVKNLTYIYDEGMPFASKALDNISFEIKDRDFVGLIGHTGSGKSTLIQHLNGLIKPSSGEIYINEFNITDQNQNLTEIRNAITYWQGWISKLENTAKSGGRNRIKRIVPRDL